MVGTLFLVVGASGVGKDTLIDLLKCRFPDFCFPRRYITRTADAGGEDFASTSLETFEEMICRDEFCVHWQAHGLRYAVHANIADAINKGQHVVLNASRKVISEFESQFENTVVIAITANKQALRQRLEKRGRETSEDIEARLAREVPEVCCRILEEIDNSGEITETFSRLEKVVQSHTR